jgi:general secretion pathway protein C
MVPGMKRATPAVLVALALAACGGGSAAPGPPPKSATPASSEGPNRPPVAEALPTGSIRRSAVRAVLTQGPGAFLQRVTLDEHAVFASGKFHGFRVARLNDAELFQGVDLKPGDVVTRINGFPIEHPEDALQVFNSLEVASELRVEYEREGIPRELRYAIVDDVPASNAAPASRGPTKAGPGAPAPQGARK